MSPVAASLPGAEILREGLEDLSARKCTINALLVCIGEPRLRRLGIEVPPHDIQEPERALYAALGIVFPDDTHGRYCSSIRRLVSLERALEQQAKPKKTYWQMGMIHTTLFLLGTLALLFGSDTLVVTFPGG